MPKMWRDAKGRAWEIKIERGETWHRTKDQGDENWVKGTPPGWTDNAKIPLDRRPSDE